jgi:hypothetical protein
MSRLRDHVRDNPTVGARTFPHRNLEYRQIVVASASDCALASRSDDKDLPACAQHAHFEDPSEIREWIWQEVNKQNN